MPMGAVTIGQMGGGASMGGGGTDPTSNAAYDVAKSGYKGSLKNLQAALKLAGTNATGQMDDAKQQLANNQGSVQQGLINSGLGNTTIAQTMAQAPLATYNRAVEGIHDSMTGQQMAGLTQLAGAQQQGGLQLGGLLASLQAQQLQAKQAAAAASAKNVQPFAINGF